MRALLLLTTTLLVAAASAFLGVQLASRRPQPQPEIAPADPLPEPAFSRTPVGGGAQGKGGTGPELVESAPPGLQPRWAELNAMAIRALEAGELERAVALFEQCVNGVADEPVFRRNLAEALARRALHRRERENPCPRCLEDLGRAVELAPAREDLARLLERWRAEAELERGFWREGSQHFDLAYDGDRSEILHGSHRLLEELEAGYTDMAEMFGVLPVERGTGRVRVVLYRREGFDALTGLGEWAGGAFDGTVRIPIEDLAREEGAVRTVLRHELAHAFILASGGPGVPGWLNEGLAQWLETGREQALEQARATLSGAEPFPLEDLQGSLSRWEDAALVSRAYAQSLLLVAHLVEQYGERVPFALVAGCKAGRPPERTFHDLTRLALGEALGELAPRR